jgi:sec-independent protein translocase protein TatA
MGNLGTGEILIIALLVLIMFGSKKIPELAQGLGKGIREFKKAVRDVEEDVTTDTKAGGQRPAELEKK